jgi:hypothetical protein
VLVRRPWERSWGRGVKPTSFGVILDETIHILLVISSSAETVNSLLIVTHDKDVSVTAAQ